jgi:hypothetical protein
MATKATADNRMEALAAAADATAMENSPEQEHHVVSLREQHRHQRERQAGETPLAKTGRTEARDSEGGQRLFVDDVSADGGSEMAEADFYEPVQGPLPPPARGLPPSADTMTARRARAHAGGYSALFKQFKARKGPGRIRSKSELEKLTAFITDAVHGKLIATGVNVAQMAMTLASFGERGRGEGHLILTFESQEEMYAAIPILGRVYVGSFQERGKLIKCPLYLEAFPGNANDLMSVDMELIPVLVDANGVIKKPLHNKYKNTGGMTTNMVVEASEGCQAFQDCYGKHMVCHRESSHPGVVRAWLTVDAETQERIDALAEGQHDIRDQIITEYAVKHTVDGWLLEEGETADGFRRCLKLTNHRFPEEDKCTFIRDRKEDGMCGWRHHMTLCPTREAYEARCEEADHEPDPEQKK